MNTIDFYDIGIIGCGPAGLSAAINAKISGKSLVLFGSGFCSRKLHKAPHVNNYLGFYDLSGEELRQNFLKHVEKMQIEIDHDQVSSIIPHEEYFELQTKKTTLKTKTVILATGTTVAQLLPGEQEMLGRGVSYCATCDGRLFTNRPVAVLAFNEEGIEEANYLAQFCSNVYLLPLFSDYRKGTYKIEEKIELLENEKATAIEGADVVSGIKLASGQLLKVPGVFIIREAVLPDKLVPGIDVENGVIKVNRDLSTNIKGLFAAGDNTGQPYQLAKAVGEGQVAVLNAIKYIDK